MTQFTDILGGDTGGGGEAPTGFSLKRALMEHSGLCTSTGAPQVLFTFPYRVAVPKLRGGIKYSLPPAPFNMIWNKRSDSLSLGFKCPRS